MTSHITCARFADGLADLLERELDESMRTAMESHALKCDECGPLLADLRKLRIDASNLPELAPSRDLWAGIAARIDAPVIPIARRQESVMRPVRAAGSRRWVSMAAAAAVLIAVTATATHYLTLRSAQQILPPMPSPSSVTALSPATKAGAGVAAAPPTAAPLAGAETAAQPSLPLGRPSMPAAQLVSAQTSAEQVYGSEIARLRAIVERRRAQLDPVTVSVIERNLKVIDDAIAQCKEALGKDPASRFLLQSLNTALENKVELLRTAAMLPSRT